MSAIESQLTPGGVEASVGELMRDLLEDANRGVLTCELHGDGDHNNGKERESKEDLLELHGDDGRRVVRGEFEEWRLNAKMRLSRAVLHLSWPDLYTCSIIGTTPS